MAFKILIPKSVLNLTTFSLHLFQYNFASEYATLILIIKVFKIIKIINNLLQFINYFLNFKKFNILSDEMNLTTNPAASTNVEKIELSNDLFTDLPETGVEIKIIPNDNQTLTSTFKSSFQDQRFHHFLGIRFSF